MSNTAGVKQFFSGSGVLITGATGFLGKVIMEKILRTCPGVENVYVLIRHKEGFADVNQRLKRLLEDPLFDKIKNDCPSALNKIIPLSGDIGMPSLSLNTNDREVLKSNVSVVIHAAATVKFNESLDTAMQLNVNGLRRILQLSRDMKHLKSLVYISTAYSNCDRLTIEEKIYPPPVGADEVLKHFSNETVTSADCAHFSHFVSESRPNTYSYTKALAEYVLTKEARDLPVCILRPSIVTATWREPVAGWVDNVNNATGLFLGIGVGALKVIKMDPSKVLNAVPVDVVANLTLCAAWDTALNWKVVDGHGFKNKEQIKVYNCCIPNSTTINNSAVIQNVLKNVRSISPTCNAIWFPSVHLTTSKLCYTVKDFLFQFLPAFLIDTFSFGRKISALKAYKKLYQASNVLEYFTMNEWCFSTQNVTLLKERLSSEDRNSFYLNLEDIDWVKYIRLYWLGIRKYILKENDSELSKARSRMNRFYWIYIILELIKRIGVIWAFYKLGYHLLLNKILLRRFSTRIKNIVTYQ